MNPRWASLTVLLLFIGGALWFAPVLASSQHGPDESAYFQAFELSLRGASPYEAPRYAYTPVFARIGAFSLSHWGSSATALGLRLVNLAAACLLAWGSFAKVASLGRARFPLAALAIIAFRPLATSLTLGNLSPLAATATLAGVAMAGRLPFLAGVALALGAAIKPTGLPALFILGAYGTRVGSKRHLTALVVAVVVLTPLLVVDGRFLVEMLGRSGEWRDASTNLSPHRVLRALGLDLPAGVLAAIVTVPCAWWVWVRPMSGAGLTAVAGLASLVWLPRIWLHSFVLVLPAIGAAIGNAVTALRSSRDPGAESGQSSRATLTATWTFLFIVCIEVADAFGDLARVFPSLPWNPGMNPIVPLAAAALLTRTSVGSARAAQ